MNFLLKKKIKSLRFFIKVISMVLYYLNIPRRIKNPDTIKKILVINNDFLGDTVISTPLYSNLRHNFPHSEITVVCDKVYLPLLESNIYVNRIIPFHNSRKNPDFPLFKRLRDAFTLLIKLRRSNYDLIVELYTDLFTLVLAIFYIFASFRMEKQRYALKDTINIYRLMIRNRSPRFYKYTHDQHKILKALNSIGVKIVTDEMSVFVKDEWKHGLYHKFQDLGIEMGKYFIIAPGASWEGKRWSSKNFSRAGDLIFDEFGYQPFICGTANESELCREVASHMDCEATVLAGGINLTEFIAIVSQARLLIGNDSGPSHLAAGLKTPVVAIMGTSDIEAFMPLGKKVRVLYREVLCGPCYSGKCYMPRNICLQPVTPEEVATAARELLMIQRS
ncbi:MAG: hypothetical protein GF307_05890 [candidate division Zixibacteria bacterium]|nr:hypothetical protein [candidate division Zixibacteria bacterium]